MRSMLCTVLSAVCDDERWNEESHSSKMTTIPLNALPLVSRQLPSHLNSILKSSQGCQDTLAFACKG